MAETYAVDDLLSFETYFDRGENLGAFRPRPAAIFW
jgi:hypothetical protein